MRLDGHNAPRMSPISQIGLSTRLVAFTVPMPVETFRGDNLDALNEATMNRLIDLAYEIDQTKSLTTV
jgi:hypothetical protein